MYIYIGNPNLSLFFLDFIINYVRLTHNGALCREKVGNKYKYKYYYKIHIMNNK